MVGHQVEASAVRDQNTTPTDADATASAYGANGGARTTGGLRTNRDTEEAPEDTEGEPRQPSNARTTKGDSSAASRTPIVVKAAVRGASASKAAREGSSRRSIGPSYGRALEKIGDLKRRHLYAASTEA